MSHTINVVFVHGWGMNSAVWDKCIEGLPHWMNVTRVDLPGHGTMAKKSASDFNSMVETVAATLTGSALWVGWSLGGLVCQRLTQLFPDKVLGLCLVASNACFVRKENWSHAVEKEVFDEFNAALHRDANKTIKRFLALQVTGSENSMLTMKQLQSALRDRGEPTSEALELGLEVLSSTDLRDSLKSIESPVLWVLGSRDTLVPVTVLESLKKLSPYSDGVVIEGAAHTPFISHVEEFNAVLIKFASGLGHRG